MRLNVRARDLTGQFREAVARIDRADPLWAVATSTVSPTGPLVKNKHRILPRRAPNTASTPDQCGLEALARQILVHITRLQQFLWDHRSDYVDVVRAAWTRGPGLTDRQKDHIDAGANRFIHTCQSLIARFQSELNQAQDQLNAGRRDHLTGVVQILERYLKDVCQIYAQQRAIRVQRELEFQKLSRLEIKARKSSQSTGESERHLESDLIDRLGTSDVETESEIEDMDSDHSDRESGGATPPKRRKSDTRLPVPPPSTEFYEETGEDEPLSPEDIQLLERENTKLYERFMENQDNVQQIENKVVRIAELQEVFADKVLQQKDDIELVHHHAVTTTENVKDANEELRKAIQNQASIRVYILFFLLVMSFSLLFLDWYNE
ncbi:hypothetical protein TCAL_08767 [Tigriopus californicus]|uniref:t-SNARE coiled-coil homology domain-containing protein n=1 Tax=Tigriopus californicus TaxID=6832 RepID=A0A553PKS6_TIGCA|nr:hypothetical protein TCAL_08767 [Tigriopus californicus]